MAWSDEKEDQQNSNGHFIGKMSWITLDQMIGPFRKKIFNGSLDFDYPNEYIFIN